LLCAGRDAKKYENYLIKALRSSDDAEDFA
jgi:hypothetical protein